MSDMKVTEEATLRLNIISISYIHLKCSAPAAVVGIMNYDQ